MTRILRTLVLASLLIWTPKLVAQEIAVIVHPDVDISAIDDNRIAQIFLGKSTLLLPYDLPRKSPIKAAFYKQATGRSLSQVRAIWTRLVFSGRAKMPKEFRDSESVKKQIASDPQGIAYVEKSAVDKSVKVVKIYAD